MKSKKASKPYWEMTTEELREATKQFDEEFVGDKGRPLTPDEQALLGASQVQGGAARQRQGRIAYCRPHRQGASQTLHRTGKKEAPQPRCADRARLARFVGCRRRMTGQPNVSIGDYDVVATNTG
jgi:hypothetical protein